MRMMRKAFLKEVGFGVLVVVLLLGITQSVSAQPYTTISITGQVRGPIDGGPITMVFEGTGTVVINN